MKSILLLLIFLTTLVFGQKSTDKISFFISPLSLIDTYSGSSYRVGTEVKIYKNLSSTFEIGSYFPSSFGMKNIKGAIGKIELKKYFKENDVGIKNYISLQGLYKKQSYNQKDTISIQDKNSYLKDYSISKNIYSLSIKYGGVSISPSGFYVDYFIGLGLRSKNVKCTLTEEEFNNKDYGLQDQIGRSIANSCGDKIVPNIVLGVRFGLFIN